MRRAALAVAILLSLSSRAAAAVGDITWSQNNHAASKYLDDLGAPSTAAHPHTAAITLGFVTPGNCLLQSTGVDGSVICASNPVGSITFTDPATNTGTPTDPIIGVKFTNVSIKLSGAGALEVAAYVGGDVTAPDDSHVLTIVNNAVTFAKFQTLPPRTIVANVGGSTANAGSLSSSSSGDAFWNNAGTLVAAPYPYSALAGAPSSLPPSGAAGGDLGSTFPNPTVVAAEFGAQRLTFSTAADGSLLKRSGTTVVGATAGTDFATTVRADGVSTGTLQLASISAANMVDGAIAWVDSVGDFFRLGQSSLAAAPLVRVAASGKAGYFWERLGVANQDFGSQATWWVDPANVSGHASDENTGATSSVPLASFAEYGRRLNNTQLTVAHTVNQMSDAPTSDPLILNGTWSMGNLGVTVVGQTTVIATGTMSAAHNMPAGNSNDHYEFTDLGNTFTPWLQKYLIHRTNGTQAWAWAYKDLGSGHLQTSMPITAGLAASTWTAGDSYEVLKPVNFADFLNGNSGALMPVTLRFVNVLGSTQWGGSQVTLATGGTFVKFDRTELGSSFPFAVGQSLNVALTMANVLIPATAGAAELDGFVTFWGGLFAGDGSTSFLEMSGGTTLGGNPSNAIMLAGRKLEFFHNYSAIRLTLNIYDWTSTTNSAFAVGEKYSQVDNIGGERNTGLLMSVDATAYVYSVSSFTTWNGAITTMGAPYNVNGTFFTQAQLGPATNFTATRRGGFIDAEGGTWAGDLGGASAAPSVIGLTGGGVDHPIDTLTAGQALSISASTGHVVSLAALAAPGSNGLLVWTGSTDVARTLTNGDGTINFNNPDGVAGNPEIHVNAIPESKVTGLTADLAGKVPTTRNINTTAPMTGGGSLAGDLTLAVPVFAGSTAGLVPPSSGGTTNFLRADGTYAAPSGAAGVTQGTGPVTFIGPGVAATAINFAGGSISGVLALGNEGSPTGTGFAHVTGGAWDPAARAVNLGGSDVTGALPVGSIAVGVGTSGQVPTIVGSSVIWATPSSPGTGTVTNVSGVPGDVNVANPTSTPSISLPDVGPGSVTTGGSGIQSVTTDHAGRIVSIATAAYQPALSFPPAHYITDSTGSGLTGDASFQREPGTNLIDVAGLVVNGASPFPNSALIVNNSTNTNRDRIQLYVGGGTAPAAAPTGDSTLVGVFPHDTALEPGVVSGIYATMRIENLTYTGSGQTITEAAGLYIDGPPNLSSVSGQTYALHVATGQTKLGGPLALPALPNGTLVTDGAGNVSAVDPGSTKRVVLSWTSQLSQASGVNWNVPFYEMIGTAGVTNVPVTPMSLGVVSGDVMPRNAVISLHVVDNVLVDSGGTCTLDFRIRENGTPLAASSTLITSGTSNGATIATKISVLTSALSSFDVQIATANCGGSSGILVTTNMIVY